MRTKEVRSFPGYTIKANSENGIIDSLVSIMGIADMSWKNDIVEPGAYKKTIAERGPQGIKKIRVLNQHTIKEVIGKPLEMEEWPRYKLPENVLIQYPNASGGLRCLTQLEMRVERVRDIFYLYESGCMTEWSIGFDPIVARDEIIDRTSYRHLFEIKLWEYSPVTWGSNDATITVEVKNNLQMFLEETILSHPEYNDSELLRAVEERLSPRSSVEPVLPLTSQGRWIESRRVQNQIDLLRLRGKV